MRRGPRLPGCRRIKELNRRRPKPAGGQSQPQVAFSFGDGTADTGISANPPAANGFSFGQSQSFPGAAPNATQNGSQPVAFGGGGSSSFNFGFGTSSAPSAGPGPGPAVNNPFSNLNGGGTQSQNQTQTGGLFNFSGASTPASQPQGVFGTAPQTAPTQPFGQLTNSSAPATAFQPQPATTGTSNLFGQSSTAPTSSSSSVFQSKPATTAPSLFGQSTPATTTGGPSLFGQSAAAPASTSSASQPQTTATTTSSLFGKSSSPAVDSGMFGKSFDTPNQSSSTFQPKPAMGGSTLFGQSSTTAPPPSSSTFKPNESLFGRAAPPPSATAPSNSNITFNQTASGPFSAPNFFGSTTSTAAGANGANVFGQAQQSKAQSGSLFAPSTLGTTTQNATGAKSLFGFNNEPEDMSTSPDAKHKTNGQLSNASSAFNSSVKQPSATTASTFAPSSNAAQPPGASNPFNLFGDAPKSTASTTPANPAPASNPFIGTGTSGFAQEKPYDSPASAAFGKRGRGPLEAFKPQITAKSKTPAPALGPSPMKAAETNDRSRLSPDENRDFTKRAQIRDLNRGFKELVDSFDPDTQNLDDVILFYLRVRKTMDAPLGSFTNKPGKRKLGQVADIHADNHLSSKKAKESSMAHGATPDSQLSPPKNKRKVSDDEEDTSPSGKRRATGPVLDATQSIGSGSTTAGIFANAFASGGSEDKEPATATPSFKPSVSAFGQPSPFGTAPSTSTASKETNLFAPKPKEGAQSVPKPAFEVPKFATSGESFVSQFGKKFGQPASKEAQEAIQGVKLDIPKFNVSSTSNFISQFSQQAAGNDDDDDTSESEDEEPVAKKTTTTPAEPKPASSVFETKSSAPSVGSNIFGHLSNSATNTEGDSSDDDLTEHLKKRASSSKQEAKAEAEEPSKGTLFDRIRKIDGTPVQVSDEEKPEAPKPQLFGQPTSNPFSSLNTSSGPSLFAPKPSTPNPFGGLAIPKPASHLLSATATPSVTSDSNADDTDTDTYKDTQLNLMSNAGEEGEDCIFNGRAKGLKSVEAKVGEKSEKSWETQGVGALRILVNRDTKRARILLRAEPSGRAVLNTSINRAIDYKIQGTSCQFLVPREDGSGMDLWTLRIKKEAAEELEAALKSAKEGLAT
ncbi:uncharacterized protein TRUGW13939_10485 [Talaromyces rugulosus]|uniref:RanBD1 domain-containing protein n=1 Tax=Talaromyces rugulosus TaxID=121627 RepID=A0A7H8RCS9_TALRU|nr:uncharacterized protein TRUGW13939_10485 [Talaromyces rugulosus]QKX63315.1 hypothetical protein TRUGW13939_10485 [Talaromyces rugulosus]